MIPFGSQRGSGGDLAIHLQNAEDNELVEIFDIRGAIAGDLQGAFSEWEAEAHALTNAKRYLYSLSINPDQSQGKLTREQYLDYIARTEKSLGLIDQPRAVVFHIKENGEGILREHCHVVWSRIDAEAEKAIHIPFDQRKLMMVTREFAYDHQLSLPEGYESGKARDRQLSLYDKTMDEKTPRRTVEHGDVVTRLWSQSDCPESFVAALEDHGYILAQGRRPYVLVDRYGHIMALPRLINDPEVRSKDIVGFLANGFPSDGLISVEDAQARQKQYLQEVIGLEKTEKLVAERLLLKARQNERREELLRDIEDKKAAQQRENRWLDISHTETRTAHQQDYDNKTLQLQFNRASNTPKGLAGFLARISGVAFARRKLHEREDRKRAEDHANAQQALAVKQEAERTEQSLRHQLEQIEWERKQRSQEQSFKRERLSLEKREEQQRAIRNEILLQAQKRRQQAPNLPEMHLGPSGRPANLAAAARRKLRPQQPVKAASTKEELSETFQGIAAKGADIEVIDAPELDTEWAAEHEQGQPHTHTVSGEEQSCDEHGDEHEPDI